MASEHCCKVDRVIHRYDLTPPDAFDGDLDDYLVARWTGAGSTDSVGVRALAEWFNKRILRSVYRAHGRSDAAVRVDADYEALRGTATPEHERAELLAELEADGIDGRELVEGFVGKSTLARHLKGCLGAEKSASGGDTGWEVDQIRIAAEAYRSRLDGAIRSLTNKGRLSGGAEAEMTATPYLSCPHCPTRVPVRAAIERGYVCPDHHDGSD